MTETAPSSTQVASGLTRKIVLSVLLAALVYAALTLYGDVRELQGTARSFAPKALAIGFALATCNYAIRVARWQYYLKRLGIHVPLGESSVIFLSAFVMSVTPGKVGEVFKSLLLYEARGTPITRTAPIVVAERLTDLLALVLLIALGSLSFEHGVAVAATSALGISGVLLLCTYKPLGHFTLDLVVRIPWFRKLGHKLREAYDALLDMTRPVPLLVGTALAFLAWGLECGSLYAIVHGFEGVRMSWDGAVFAYSVSTIAGAVAMMPGGLGVTEIGMTALLQTLGGPAMRPAVATASTILVRLATLWFAVVNGVVALGIYRAFYRPARRLAEPA
ncbi:MAG TPA: lysylphosphatidylglycerol synthase transmembrane domain-containing protein [Polyangiales bacterium]|nr:lysylphosphatidylglycerol synthase transmembrane domain-containing protein [Polyangiales bacterium]